MPLNNQIEEMKKRKTGTAFSSSAIFPFILSKENSTHILFSNYWVYKNSLDPSLLNINCKFRKENSEIIKEIKLKGKHKSFWIDVKSCIKNFYDFDEMCGSVEIFITSKENLRMRFPAINCYQFTKDYGCSVVHSAGRVKHHDELKINEIYEETNISFSKNPEWVPWIFVIGDNFENTAIISFFNSKHDLILKFNYLIPDKLYSCKIIKFNEIEDFIKNRDFLLNNEVEYFSVKLNQPGNFTRLIGGSYNPEKKIYTLTHSFPYISKPEFVCDSPSNLLSFIPIPTSDQMGCNLISFPTNGPTISKYINNKTNEIIEMSSFPEQNAALKSIDFPPQMESKLSVLEANFEQKKLPVRQNVSYQFYLAKNFNQVKNFPDKHTEIPLGHKVFSFPRRSYQWGNGWISNNIDTEILIWIYDEEFSDKSIECKLVIHSEKMKEIIISKVLYSGNSYTFKVSEIFRNAEINCPKEKVPIYWNFVHEKVRSETFSIIKVSNQGENFIAGEHGY